ncbi:MAG: molybdate ABC transporter substrate-binding protein [Chloroflexaceae bacterium]|nr:molybdate ABC transporter substrate-binding protein [Chloroflexaceae bacterium]
MLSMTLMSRWEQVLTRVLVSTLLLSLLLTACGPPPAPPQPTSETPMGETSSQPVTETPPQPEPETPASAHLIVFAAASLTESYQELGSVFEAAHPGTIVTLNLAGSQQLAQQLAQGAPADVFASANTKQMTVAIEAGRVVSGTQQVFAHNRLVAIVSTESPAAVEQLHDLAQPDIKLVLAAKEVPVGGYALDFLDKAAHDPAFGPAYQEGVLNNVVSYEQTVKAVLTKVALGEGDAGIVYSSDVTASAAEKVTIIPIPDHLNTIATYPIASVSDSLHPALAQAFVDFILSPEGQTILAKHGFITDASSSSEVPTPASSEVLTPTAALTPTAVSETTPLSPTLPPTVLPIDVSNEE